MKRFLLVLVLLMFAGSVFAAELKVNGDMYVRGSTLNNMALAESNEANYSYFDYELNINAALIVNEKATVFTRLSFDRDVRGTGYVPDGDGTAGKVDIAADPPIDFYGVLNVERAYINYKFAPYLQLNTGLMGGGQFASTFNDNEANVMRVQLIGALSKDMIFIATYEKRNEQGGDYGFNGVKNAEKDDMTVYYLASRMQFANITVMPLIYYGQQGLGNAGDYNLLLAGLGALYPAGNYKKNYSAYSVGGQLGINGDFGMFGFVSEFGYAVSDTDGLAKSVAATPDAVFTAAGLDADEIAAIRKLAQDTTTFGFMIDVFAKVDALKAGLVVAYGSADKKDGKFNFGDDFDMFVVMDDYVSNTATGLAGYTAIKLYADYTMDKITGMLALGYGMNNADFEATEDGSFMEFDLGASYAFDANTAYTVMFGYAMTEDFRVKGADADAWRLYHKFAVKF